MATTLIQIKPGVFIKVNRKVKEKVGVLGLRLDTDEEGRLIGRARNRGVRYSRLLLDEAVAISEQEGMNEAAKKTGVKYWSIMQRRREMRREGKLATPPKRRIYKTKYTPLQKQQCVAMAEDLVKGGWATHPAFKEAGRRLGVNGNSIHWMWTQGMIKPSSP
jgi:hypothetical protein